METQNIQYRRDELFKREKGEEKVFSIRMLLAGNCQDWRLERKFSSLVLHDGKLGKWTDSCLIGQDRL